MTQISLDPEYGFSSLDMSGLFVSGTKAYGISLGGFADTKVVGEFYSFKTSKMIQIGFTLLNYDFSQVRLFKYGRGSTVARGISPSGHIIVGNYQQYSLSGNKPAKLSSVVSWDGGGFLESPKSIPSNFYLCSVNDAKQIVGFQKTSVGLSGFLLEHHNNKISKVHPHGSVKSAAFGINNAGIIVGYYQASAGEGLRGFVRQGEAYDILEVPSAKDTVANGLNEDEIIVGDYRDGGGVWHGFVYSKDSGFIPLDYPGALETRAMGINLAGVIVGWYRDAAGKFHGYWAEPVRTRKSQPMIGEAGI